jgi:hypothetical protein
MICFLDDVTNLLNGEEEVGDFLLVEICEAGYDPAWDQEHI